jgi:hypothetical protein
LVYRTETISAVDVGTGLVGGTRQRLAAARRRFESAPGSGGLVRQPADPPRRRPCACPHGKGGENSSVYDFPCYLVVLFSTSHSLPILVLILIHIARSIICIDTGLETIFLVYMAMFRIWVLFGSKNVTQMVMVTVYDRLLVVTNLNRLVSIFSMVSDYD